MSDPRQASPDYECVEPELGDQMALLVRADLDPRLAALLRSHLAICDACRLGRAVEQRLPQALASAPRARRLVPRWRGGTWGGVALAAGLALMMLLPPRPDGDDLLPRGVEEGVRLLRPVEGEVVVAGHPRIRWSPADDATGYRVRVEAMDGSWRWDETVDGATASTRVTTPLPAGSEFRIYLEPTPADLAPPGGVAVACRSGSALEVAGYRLGAAPLPAQLLAAAGALVWLAAGYGRWIRRRPAP